VTGDRSRLRRLADAVDARLRGNQKAVRAVIAMLGLALVAVLAAAAWPIAVEILGEHAAAADPRPLYVKGVQEKISKATDAALAAARPRELPASLKLRIEVDAEGNLTSAKVTESSGDADTDELTLRIVRSAAPFGPFPPEMRRTTKVVELNSDFHFQ
jgi:TonB family protein